MKGTPAYRRLDMPGAPGTALTAGRTVPDLSGKHDDPAVVPPPSTDADARTWSDTTATPTGPRMPA